MRASKMVRFGLSGLMALSLLAVAAPAAMASGGGDGVEKRGSCSGNADWKLRLRPEDGGKIEVEFEVEHAKPGSTWGVVLKDNGTRFFSGTRTANSVGEFEVRRLANNQAGSDTIRARATNQATGQVCSGTATL